MNIWSADYIGWEPHCGWTSHNQVSWLGMITWLDVESLNDSLACVEGYGDVENF